MERENEMDFSTNTTVKMVMNTTGSQQLYSQAGLVIISLIVAAIIAVTVVGNIFVILAYCRDPRIRNHVPNVYVLNLAITDLIVGVFSMTFNLSRFIHGFWPYGEIMCKLWTILDITARWVSFMTIVLIGWCSHFIFNGASWTLQQKRGALVLIFCWVIMVSSATIAVSSDTLGEVKDIDYNITCRMEFTSLHMPLIISNFFPFILILFAIAMYIKLFDGLKLRRSGRDHGPTTKVRPMFISRPYSNKKPPSQSIEQVITKSSCSYAVSKGSASLEQADEIRPQNTMNATNEPVGSRPEIRMPDFSEIASEHPYRSIINARKPSLIILFRYISLLVFVLPYNIMTVVCLFCGSDCVSDVVWEVTEVLSYCNSTINLVIYAGVQPILRENFRYFVQLDRCKCDARKCYARCK